MLVVFRVLTGRHGLGYGDFKLLAALSLFCMVLPSGIGNWYDSLLVSQAQP